MKLKYWLFTLAAMLPYAAAKGVDVRMLNVAQVPKINQAQNFANLMNPRGTDLAINNNQLTYQQLPTAGGANLGDTHAQVDPNRVRIADGRPAQIFTGVNSDLLGYRQFRNGDLADINGGAFHCSPTSAAMIMQYWAARMNMPALGQGNQETVVQYIDAIANAMDTNDQNANVNNNDQSGHFGTLVANISDGMNAFAGARVNGIQMRAAAPAAFDANTYRRLIDNNQPVLVSFREQGTLLGHSVVGIGYATNGNAAGPLTGLFIRDPATNNNEDSMRLPNGAQIIPFNRGDGFRNNTEYDIYISTSDAFLLEDAVMYDFEVVPEPRTIAFLAIGICGIASARRKRPGSSTARSAVIPGRR
jgi:hypothetical protein